MNIPPVPNAYWLALAALITLNIGLYFIVRALDRRERTRREIERIRREAFINAALVHRHRFVRVRNERTGATFYIQPAIAHVLVLRDGAAVSDYRFRVLVAAEGGRN